MEKLAEYPEILAGASVGVLILMILGFIFIFWLFNIFCMMIGAKVADISNRSFGKAFVASILIAWLGGTVIGGLSFVHPILGVLGVIFVPAIFIKVVYSCGLGKAVVAYIINIVVSIVLMTTLIFTLIFGLGFSLDKLKKHENSSEPNQVESQK